MINAELQKEKKMMIVNGASACQLEESRNKIVARTGGLLKSLSVLLMASCYMVALPAIAGSLNPPATAVDSEGNPKPTMKTLGDVPSNWSQIIVDENERFVPALDGSGAALLDRETGLVWMTELVKGADGLPIKTLGQYVGGLCESQYIAGRYGWRLPSFSEITGLVIKDLSTLDRSETYLPSAFNFGNPSNTNLWVSDYAYQFIENGTPFFIPGRVSIIEYFGWNMYLNKYSTTSEHQFTCVRGPK